MGTIYKTIFLFLFSLLFTTAFAQEIDMEGLAWQKKLDIAKEGGYKNIITNNGLTLVKYEINKAINPSIVKKKKIDSTTVLVIPQTFQSGYENKFIVGTYSDKKVIKTLNEDRSKMLSLHKDKRLIVVDLYWKHKEQTYVTHCLIDEEDNQIVFDDFLSYVIVLTKEKGYESTGRRGDLTYANPDKSLSGNMWQQQLEYAKKREWLKNKLGGEIKAKKGLDDIRLLEYSSIGTVNSATEIPVLIEKLFSGDNL